MQLKRIFVSLLVAVMMISMAVLAVSAAETEDKTFVVAVDTVDNEGYLAVTPGETVEIPVIVTNNPGVCYTYFLVTYDEEALEYAGKFTAGDLFAIASVKAADGRTVVVTNLGASKDVTATGTLVTLVYNVKDTFAGDKVQVHIESVEAANAKNETVIGVGTSGSTACSHADTTAIPAVAATCVAEGKTAGEKCATCGLILVESEVVPATGVHTPSAAATCTTAQICTVCGEELAPVVDHTLVAIGDEIPASCTAAGLTAGQKCSVCNVIIEAQTPVAATGHTEETIPAVDATCTSTGLTAGKKCSVCGTVIEAQTSVAAKAHTEVAIEAVAASCTAAGSTEGKKCSVCGAITVAPEVVQPTGHTLEEIPAVEPTASKEGSTAGQKCTVCGEIIDAPDVIPAESLAWLWVLIICVVVVAGGATAFYFLYLKKRLAK